MNTSNHRPMRPRRHGKSQRNALRHPCHLQIDYLDDQGKKFCDPYTQTLERDTRVAVYSPVVSGLVANNAVVALVLTEDTHITVHYRRA